MTFSRKKKLFITAVLVYVLGALYFGNTEAGYGAVPTLRYEKSATSLQLCATGVDPLIVESWNMNLQITNRYTLKLQDKKPVKRVTTSSWVITDSNSPRAKKDHFSVVRSTGDHDDDFFCATVDIEVPAKLKNKAGTQSGVFTLAVDTSFPTSGQMDFTYTIKTKMIGSYQHIRQETDAFFNVCLKNYPERIYKSGGILYCDVYPFPITTINFKVKG